MAGKYHLTEEETKNIKFRRMVFDYLSNLINDDTGRYIYTTVRPRLNLKDDVKLELSEDAEWIMEVNEKTK